jgi:hypothetical protein
MIYIIVLLLKKNKTSISIYRLQYGIVVQFFNKFYSYPKIKKYARTYNFLYIIKFMTAVRRSYNHNP